MLVLLFACAAETSQGLNAPDASEPRDFADPSFAAYSKVCADNAELTQGIDVSYWQSTINWDSVAASGVEFAIIRVSHGLGTYDTKFTTNWSEAKRVGVRRGVYQYFSGSDDPVAQAEMLLDEMGELEDGDLPPTLDVELGDNEGISTSQMNANIQTWMDVVEGALGVTPMIYTGASAWGTMTGEADFTEHPLWTANWTSDCPYVADPWTDWTFWQYSSTGSVSGISTAVDLDVFDGNASQLEEWSYHPLAECSGTCLVAQEGETVVEEDATCACGEGGLSSIDGHDGHAYTTVSDEAAGSVDDGVTWPLRFERAGTYDVSMWVPNETGLTAGAVVEVSHDGITDTVTVDESSVSAGWLYLGAFHFSTTGSQSIRVGDGYDDAGNSGKTVVIDALSFTPVDGGECSCEGDDAETQDCSDGSVRTRECDGCDWTAWTECTGAAQILSSGDGCGCSTGAGSAAGAAIAALAGGIVVTLGRRRKT
ncbi:hypothetical protein LBMAG42_44930 [Deltaproteobacteria bacterium]|nr:hypothetical protein LBMAG42_44930 [Deltaproteobacteria bacterium]